MPSMRRSVPRPRVVFDTNIFLRALFNPKEVNACLVPALNQYTLVTSPEILEEVVEVRSRADLLHIFVAATALHYDLTLLTRDSLPPGSGPQDL